MIEAYGTGFIAGEEGETSLLFRGEFIADGGGKTPVELNVPARFVDRGTVRWTSYGPFANPFTAAGNETGTFTGTLGARLTKAGGEVIDDDAPIDVSFEVLPSVLVRELEPISASCSKAVGRALGGAAYRMRVEAIGFQPESFTYEISMPALDDHGLALRHLAEGRFDAAGERGDIVMPPVPEGMLSYSAIISIVARASDGATYTNAFAVAVHRPLEVFFDGAVEIAEVLAPVPVSGCIPGGDTGRNVEYGETQTETRSRDYNVSWNQSWLSSHTVSGSTMNTVGQNETNGVGFATNDGQNWNWSVGGEVSGSFGLSDLISFGASVNGSTGRGGSHNVENSSNQSTSINSESTTTETETAAMESGGQTGGGFAWQVSSSENIARGFSGRILPQKYGVFYRQTVRLLRRASVVAFNQCGAATVVGDVQFEDWAWSPDLALGDSCPPLPASNLPAPTCVIPPCAGE